MFEIPFIDACLNGDASLDDIENYIEQWHSLDTDTSIEEFLGMTPYEYGEWLKCGEDIVLRDIMAAREERIPYEEYKLMSVESRIAARSYDEDFVSKIEKREKNNE